MERWVVRLISIVSLHRSYIEEPNFSLSQQRRRLFKQLLKWRYGLCMFSYTLIFLAWTLAGMEVIFFIAACKVLVWICDQNSIDSSAILAVAERCLHSICFSLHPPSEQAAGWTRGKVGMQLGQLASVERSDIPYHIMACYSVKLKWGEHSQLWHLSSQIAVAWWNPVFLEMAKCLPADGK